VPATLRETLFKIVLRISIIGEERGEHVGFSLTPSNLIGSMSHSLVVPPTDEPKHSVKQLTYSVPWALMGDSCRVRVLLR